MSENLENKEKSSQPVGESWKEVGQQFEALGSSLAQAFRTTWSNIETKTDAQQVKSSLETMVREVGQAIDDTAKAPEGQKVKEYARRTGESLRTAGEKTYSEAKPQILTALQKVNAELKKMIDKLEQSEKPKEE